MAWKKQPRELRWRPAYLVQPDGQGGWCVRRRGQQDELLGTNKTRAAACRRAEELANQHIMAQIVLYKKDGSFDKEYALFNEEHRAQARALLEERLSPFQDYDSVDTMLMQQDGCCYAVNEDVVIAGETMRLTISIHEGQSWDEAYVHGKIWDELFGPAIVEINYTLWPQCMQ